MRVSLALVLLTPVGLSAQEVSVSAGRWLTSSHVSEYRLSPACSRNWAE